MSLCNNFTKENINIYLNDFAEEYIKLTNGEEPLKMILVGGASILLNFCFKKTTNNIDYSNPLSDDIVCAVKKTAGKHGLFKNWLNNDFRKTSAYSDKIDDISVFYKKISDIVEIRTISSEYLILMKLINFRDNKHDLSDIVGILLESKENNKPLNIKDIENDAIILYGNTDILPKESMTMLNILFDKDNYKEDILFLKNREITIRNKDKKLMKENILNIKKCKHKALIKKAIKIIAKENKKKMIREDRL